MLFSSGKLQKVSQSINSTDKRFQESSISLKYPTVYLTHGDTALPEHVLNSELTGLLRGTFMSWWYLPESGPVTDMQHYYHARYPTDDWHLACTFSLVYFSVEVCLEVCPILLAYGQITGPVYPSWTGVPPSRENNIVQGVTRFSTWAKRRGIWTDARVCLHYWMVIWVVGYCNLPLLLHIFGLCHGQDTYGLKVVFCFRHFTASHYHHYASVLTGVENL